MLKVGMIGCGGISGTHVNGWHEVERQGKARLVATADVVEARAKERAAQLSAEKYYTDYMEILKRDDIDAVDIMLPHYLHREATVKAAEHGKHVMCIKPMARTLEEGREMIQACKENKVILAIGHMSRFKTEYIKTKELIDKGVLGKMFLVRIMYGFYPGLKDFHYKKDLIGGGVLISTGTHILDIMNWFVGDVKTVSYAGNSMIRGMEGEDTAAVALEYENGAVGVLMCSWATRGLVETFWIHGSDGTLTTEDGVQFIDNDGKVTKYETQPVDSFGKKVEHFVDCLINKTESTIISGMDGYKSMEVALAAYKSGEEKKIISLSELR
jgi:predicted dehydrogenase